MSRLPGEIAIVDAVIEGRNFIFINSTLAAILRLGYAVDCLFVAFCEEIGIDRLVYWLSSKLDK